MPNIIPSLLNLPTGKSQSLDQELIDKKKEFVNLQKEDSINTLENKTDELKTKVNGDIATANADVSTLRSNTVDPLGAAINQRDFVAPGTVSPTDLHRTFLEEINQGFIRGVGQSISSTGDLLNFVGSALPGVTMMDGNIFGNGLNSFGQSIEEGSQSYVKPELLNENITWSSLADPDFWSKRASEMIPLALEFWAMGGMFSAAAKGLGKTAARKAGANMLEKAIQTTSTSNKLRGLTQIDEVIGTGKGFGKLIRNVDGVGELSTLGANVAGFTGAGLSSNLMAGAMNAMELHKEMKASGNYTEEEMADAAASSFTNNMLYLPVDILSWGITYGGGLKNLKGKLPFGGVVDSAKAMKDAGSKFTYSVMPFMKGAVTATGKLADAAKKAFFEGIEETFQETFEEWAKKRGKASVTGEEVPNYFDFYMSDENRATKVLSFATGGLMGGGVNIKEAFNKNANDMAKYYDRTENLKASINTEDKLGQEAREYHMQNQMFDLINEGKERFFGDFLTDLQSKEQITPEQGEAYQELFDVIKTDFDNASNLNVAGKEALMRNTVEARFLEQSIGRDMETKNEIIKNIKSEYEPGPDQDAAIAKQIAAMDESINSKLIILSKARANRLNLISGKLADPLNIQFVVSKTGKEHFIVEDIIGNDSQALNNKTQNPDGTVEWNSGNSAEDIQLALEQGAVAGGLSDEQYRDYVDMSDDEIFALAAKKNSKGVKALKGKAREIYDGLKNKFIKPEENEEGTGPADNIADENIIDATATDIDTSNTSDKPAEETPVVSDEETKAPTEEVADKKPEAKAATRSENENEFEKAALDNPDFIDSKKESIKQKQSREEQAAKDNFVKDENDEAVEEKKTAEQQKPEVKPEPVIEKQAREGRSSIISKIFKKSTPVASSPESKKRQRAQLEQRISEINTTQASARRQIALKTLSNNPDIKVSKSELDSYLNSSIAKISYGPNQVQKMIALNRRLRSMGIDVDVISATNLFETVGVDALGYAIANTVFIDEKSWEQPEVLMHEMSHIYYRTMKNNPVVTALINKAYNNREFVNRIKDNYFEDVKYSMPDGNGETIYQSATDLGITGSTQQDIKDFMKEQSFDEAPMEFQDIVNEEVFAHYIEGPLSDQFSSFFKPVKEFGRKVETRNFWSYLKKESVKYVQDNRDLVQALNDGKSVSVNEMKEFIMKGFTTAIADNKDALISKGFASRIASNKAAQEKELKTISDRKVEQQNKFNKQELLERFRKSVKDKTIDKIKKEINSNENLTEKQREIETELALDEYENSFEDTTNFDDFEQVKALQLKGATRILNSFVKSLNYVKRQQRLRDTNKSAAQYDDSLLDDRDALISEVFNLAYETKGNTGLFIQAIENSEIREIDAFNKYLDKLYPQEKLAILNSMAWVMSNSRTISGVKSYVDAQGKHIIENALSERERNRVDSLMKKVERNAAAYYDNINNGNEDYNKENPFTKFENSYQAIKRGNASNEDYLNVISYLSPYGVKFSNIIKSNNISFKGGNYTVKNLVNNFVKQGVIEQGKNLYISRARSFVEALTDTNRKYTSYSSIQNAEGNFEPSKITNNHLLSEIDYMNAVLATKPSFKKFKQKFGHINDASKRKYENPVLKSIYDNYMAGKRLPAVTQYFGLKHDQAKINNLYKNSTDFTQSIEDFMMFDASNTAYLQNMGAFADSPRKFYTQVDKLPFKEIFTTEGKLSTVGSNQLKNAFSIYEKLNENLSAKDRTGLFQNYEEFIVGFNKSVQQERALWNSFGEDLKSSSNLAKYFDKGKLTTEGNKKLTEYIFNSAVNGLALSEIFNPGVPVKDIIKRNKGNSSPVNSTGNRNLKIEPVIIPDANDKSITDSAMFMLRSDAEKIIKAGLGVFDMNNGLKLLNYSIDRENPNFSNRAAYFKGYTTIIDENTLIKEPGLRGIHELLMQRKNKYDQYHLNKYGEYSSDDLLNGMPNYLNVAIPMSAIKSDFLTPEQQAKLNTVTIERLNDAADENTGSYDTSDAAAIDKIYDELFYNAEGDFMGISGYNFGPQQVMDKITTESTTPVQFISSVIVNGATQGTLERAEEIQRLIRTEQATAMDAIIKQLNNMNPTDYKKFILDNMDLENMDQAQRLIMQEEVNNLNHTAIEDFVLNTLANRLKSAGNKLKTAGTIAQQKSNVGYRLPNNYYVNSSAELQGYTQRDNGGQNPLEIVLPKHMQGKVRPRQYFTINDNVPIMNRFKNAPKQAQQYNNSTPQQKLEIIKTMVQDIAINSYPRVDNDASYGFKNSDLIGTVENKNGEIIGYFVKGEIVLATRVPSHGPASTGVFEVVDFLSGEGNQTIVSNEFSKVVGSDYDGDALFIQHKSPATKNFNKALDLSVELWTSPEMAEQIQTSIDFEKEVQDIVKNNKKSEAKIFPMSPQYNRDAYNNTMVSKRSIGVVFNMHRLANYLAAYNVRISTPIKIDANEYTGFSDNETGQNSRNNNSAKLANIILDNTKWHFADKLGLNDQTINQFTLLVNMGVSLSDLNKIMNSEAVTVWTKYKKNNQSPYLKNKSARELRKKIKTDLGIDEITKTSYLINTAALNTPQQKANIIAVMEYLENMNSDVLKLSKIMAGHKGINNNPFILEKQISEFNDVVDNKESNLIFNNDFRNNPDVKAYHDNAEKILDILKKANKIFRPSTEKLLSQLDSELAIDGMTEKQLDRASAILKKFINSRVLGFNNISTQEKETIRQNIFDKIFSYMDSLATVETANGSTGLENSLLFQKALNLYFNVQKNGIDSTKSYISANPAFFNESISLEEKQQVQQEFQALSPEIKNDLIVYDLIKNGLTGNLSLVNVFDEYVNFQISNRGFFDQVNKNNEIDSDVMKQLKQIIISAEITSPDSTVPVVNYDGKIEADRLANVVRSEAGVVYNKMRNGEEFYFTVNNKGRKSYYHFAGIPKSKLLSIEKVGGSRDSKEKLVLNEVNNAISNFEPISGDLDLQAISISDTDISGPLKASETPLNSSKADYIKEANIIEEKKKSNEGRASKIDYHNYNDYRELSRQEYDRVMEYNPAVSDEQKQTAYELYLIEKKHANSLTSKINQASVVEMTDAELKTAYNKYADKDVYAYSVITTPLVMEFANRASIEQSKITDRFEDGSDMTLVSSWLNNNNISSNQPATQALTRKLSGGYKTFVKERGKYIKEINKVTEALYKEKFGLSNNRLLQVGQRIYNSLFKNRVNLYERLYGNLVETNFIKLPNNQERKEFKFKDRQEINRMHADNEISDAEFEFYNTFTKITGDLLPFGSPDGKIRKDYIPHTAMNNFELFSSRGVLGLMVNSHEENDAIGDVKMYFKNEEGKKELIAFSDIKNNFNTAALAGGNKFSNIREFRKYQAAAKKLLKEGKNEDGTRLEYSRMQTATALGMGPMSRFASSRSMTAEEMPSMDLNKALVDYVHATLFTNGNENFEGFKELMPLIDGVMAYNDKNGYKNSYNYVKEVIKEKFINKKDQNVLGPKSDKVINGLVKGNLLYALGYKGFVLGKGLYAIGNIAIGKYMNIKREGGKAWLNGELRYWGTDKGFGPDALQRRRRAKNILNNLGFMEIDLYDDVSIESKSGLDGIFTSLALLPMSVSENWIQKAQFLGTLTDEEFDKFDDMGNYKDFEQPIDRQRILELEERVKNTHGKGYSPVDQSRIQTYSLGRMMMQFSRHIPGHIRERFAKEDVDMHGQKYIGSMRQMYITASDIVNNKMSPEAFKKYYASLKPHEKEALLSGMRGVAMVGMLGFVDSTMQDSSDKLSADNISRGTVGDANVHFDLDKLSYKMIPPSIRSLTSVLYNTGNNVNAATVE